MGVLHVLLQVSETISVKWLQDVEASIDCVMTMETSTADFPLDLGHEDVKEPETSFMTGTASSVFLLCKAAEIFPKKGYKEMATRLGESCWYRGLQTKVQWDGSEGPIIPDIYNGAASNGFAHLRLYDLTKDMKYIHRALKFARVLKEELGPDPIWPPTNETGAKPPGVYRSLGLFDGLGGIINFFSVCEKAVEYSQMTPEDQQRIDLPSMPLFGSVT